MLFGVGVYVVFCFWYSVVFYSNVSFSGLIISVGEERAGFSAIEYSLFCCVCSNEFPLPRLLYFIVAPPV